MKNEIKIQEYKPIRSYVGFQWSGESAEEVQKVIKEIGDYLSVGVPYTVVYLECFLELLPNSPGFNARFATRGDHIIISDDGKVEILSRFMEKTRFNISTLEKNEKN